MSEFLNVLAFSWIPFACAVIFALTASPLGAILSLRDEIMLGIALAPVGTAAIVTAVWMGIPADATVALHLCAVIGILAVSLIMPRKTSRSAGSPRRRSAFLAAVFCAGEAVTILVSSVSTSVEAHMRHMMRGELLAIGRSELAVFAALTTAVILLGYRYRGYLYALAIDEEGLVARERRRAGKMIFGFRLFSAVIIAAGVMWAGPLMTMGLLAVPAMLYERRAGSLAWLLLGAGLIGVAGVTAGFTGSILLDLPPVPVVIAALFLFGGLVSSRPAALLRR